MCLEVNEVEPRATSAKTRLVFHAEMPLFQDTIQLFLDLYRFYFKLQKNTYVVRGRGEIQIVNSDQQK
jgi:hypothetical protein